MHNNEKLLLQQFFHLHPIMKKNARMRIAYLSLIKYLCGQYAEDYKWANSQMKLMKDFFMQKDSFFPIQITKKNEITFTIDRNRKQIFNYKFFKYRYNILTDCLMINAFSDIEHGRAVLSRICEIFPQNINKLNILFNNFYNVDIDVIRSRFPRMLGIYRVIDNNRKFICKPEKRIMITANMSAGKSTLLNSLVGKNVSKTQSCVCTSKIHYLFNKSGDDDLSCELDYDLELNATQKILMEDNDNNLSTDICVATRFRSLYEINNRICFIDTPGVNSSQNEDHRELTDAVISDNNCDLLIYLLNGENIGTDDDVRHLRFVSENYHGKIIFLVNKVDKYKKGTDSVHETLTKAKKDLEKFGFGSPAIYPISAYAAYLAKMSIFNEELTDDERDDLEFMRHKLSKDEYRFDGYFGINTVSVDENDEDEVLLRNSGMLSLEQIIYE